MHPSLLTDHWLSVTDLLRTHIVGTDREIRRGASWLRGGVRLAVAMRRFGVPEEILTDNGKVNCYDGYGHCLGMRFSLPT